MPRPTSSPGRYEGQQTQRAQPVVGHHAGAVVAVDGLGKDRAEHPVQGQERFRLPGRRLEHARQGVQAALALGVVLVAPWPPSRRAGLAARRGALFRGAYSRISPGSRLSSPGFSARYDRRDGAGPWTRADGEEWAAGGLGGRGTAAAGLRARSQRAAERRRPGPAATRRPARRRPPPAARRELRRSRRSCPPRPTRLACGVRRAPGATAVAGPRTGAVLRPLRSGPGAGSAPEQRRDRPGHGLSGEIDVALTAGRR